MKQKIIIICGPTGIGKTSFSIQLAKKFNGEIISADSMQIYKFMDIGTATPEKDEIRQVKHHLINIIDPEEEFDAGKFEKYADEKIIQIYNENKMPFITGGTGLYIKALLHGLFRTRPINSEIINKLNNELEVKGQNFLYNRLLSIDSQFAKKLHPNDTFRIIRALEIFESSNKTMTELQTDHSFKNNKYDYIKIGLFEDRKILYDRINNRVDRMIEQGLVKEVKQLLKLGYSFELKSMNSIGYRHIGLFIQNKIDWDETVRLLKRDTRRYAKRQFTWFNSQKDIIWLKPAQINKATNFIKEFLT